MPPTNATTVPLSEAADKFRPEWGKAECIAELRRIAEAEPQRVITRNHFRNTAACSESTWNQYFGTWREFKSAAGVTLTRHAKQLESQIARHASVDRMRAFNAERFGYSGKYLKPRRGRFKQTLIGSDLHDEWCDPFWLRVFVDAARRVQPDKIVLGGDLFDLPEFGKYTVDPRVWNPVARFRRVHAILRMLREAAPNAEIDLLEGNHEYRLLRHLSEATPALRTVLADLHGFTVAKLFGLDEFEVNYHSVADLGVFKPSDMKAEVSKNYLVCWDAVLVHHFPAGRDMGIPGVHGHHHHHLVWRHYSKRYGASEWHQLGCGHRRRASYCDADKWNNGFVLVHTDCSTSRSLFEYTSTGDFAVFGGEYYARKKSEQFE